MGGRVSSFVLVEGDEEQEEEWVEQGWMGSLPRVGSCVAAAPFDPEASHFVDTPGLLAVRTVGQRLSVLQWDGGSGWTCVRDGDGGSGFVPTNILAIQEEEEGEGGNDVSSGGEQMSTKRKLSSGFFWLLNHMYCTHRAQ